MARRGGRVNRASISHGLVIDQPWVGLIADGKKTWEMRTRPTRIRGWIGLIEKGSGTIIGVAYLKDSLPVLRRDKHHLHYRKHRVPSERGRKTYGGKYLYPWVMAKAFRLPKAVPYRHPAGAVIWVTLLDDVALALKRQIRRTHPEEQT
jgi:ASCH domain